MKADVQPILQVKEIYKRFGGLVAVDHVSLDIYPGEVVGLLGDNGAGKSTLIKMISGAYKPDGGQILIGQLSGGQRQAVSIARAVYWKARLMIMDEPTAALGVPEQLKVLELIRALRSQDVPVILISHNMQDVFAVADRAIVMRRGSKAGERKISETNENEVVSLMVGAEYTPVIKQIHDAPEEVHITTHDESEKDYN